MRVRIRSYDRDLGSWESGFCLMTVINGHESQHYVSIAMRVKILSCVRNLWLQELELCLQKSDQWSWDLGLCLITTIHCHGSQHFVYKVIFFEKMYANIFAQIYWIVIYLDHCCRAGCCEFICLVFKINKICKFSTIMMDSSLLSLDRLLTFIKLNCSQMEKHNKTTE